MSLRLLSVVTMLASVTLIGSSALHAQARAPNKSTAEVYKVFLISWQGKDKARINVAEDAEALSKQDLEDISLCAGGHHEWSPAETNASLASQLSTLPWIRLVDPAKWQAADPGNLIAKGKPVDEAVEQGFSHALLTLSTVAFDSSGEFAALKYSLVCGQLCGNGGTVLFEHIGQGWVRNKKRCGMWLSHSVRPNISFKADGSAAT